MQRIFAGLLLAPESGTPIFGGGSQEETSPKIRAFDQGLSGKRHRETWKRPTNLTGTGATHIRSFHSKLSSESLVNLDRQINEWLDEHTDYEVKFVTTSVGEWTGKMKEPHLIVQLWV